MTEADLGVVHEVTGADLQPRAAAAVIGMGVVALLIAGLAPALLGAMVEEHRITDAQLGLTAMLELLFMGISTGLAGAFLKPAALRSVGVGACLLFAAANVATIHASGVGVLVVRALAGIPEGLLLWITVGMIARSRTPERWAGVFFTAQVVAQLALALLYASIVIPRFGAGGGFAVLALASLLGLAGAMFLPPAYGALLESDTTGAALPWRGILALVATVVFVSGNGAISVYLQPLALRAGLNGDVARTAVWCSLAAQICGGVFATALAGKVRYIAVFTAAAAGLLTAWTVFGFGAPALPFIAANALAGISGLLVGAFLAPMLIDADPSRRSAMQSGGAQLLGGAGGPLLAAVLIGDHDVRGVLWMGGALMLTGFAMVVGLFFTKRAATGS
ncbi:MAG: hypothetical protein M3N05_08785 [Pseudomonadota bacterium]|nr:hypothetical protein [Pseudomonadota bacterium]